MSAPTAAGPAQLLLNALPDDELALKDVLDGLQQQGLFSVSAIDPKSVGPTTLRLSTPPPDVSVLTVWSRQSILDERVVGLAHAALESDRLIPIRIEEVDPPIGFRQAQTYDIVNLTRETGVGLAQELQPGSPSAAVGQAADPRGANRLLIRVADWCLFVIPTILIYAAVFKALLHGTSVYITFVAGAFIVVDTALIGVPAFLGPNDSRRALEKLLHCSRIDLTLQLILAVVLGVFATSQAPDASDSWIIVLLLSMISASAVALVTRYLVIGLWLAFKSQPDHRARLAPLLLIGFLAPTVLYAAIAALLLPGLVKFVLLFYIAVSSAQAMLFDVPGFEPLDPERAARVRVRAFRFTVTDLIVQLILSLAGGTVLHAASGQPTLQCIARLAACSALATIGRYLCLRLWLRGRGRRLSVNASFPLQNI